MSKNSANQTVLVVGSTGFVGMEICRLLVKAGKDVKALVRSTSNPEKIKKLQEMGVETRVGDLKNADSIKKAIEGIEAVISTASSTLSRQEGDSIESVDNNGQLNLVQIAEDSGVHKFVFISFYPINHEFPVQIAKRHVEKKLMESKLNYTILQPGFFMEVWLSPAVGFDYQNSKVTIYGEGNNKIAWTSLFDVAALAVATLDNKAARNSVFPLCGPEELSPLEVVKEFENHFGNSFSIEYVPVHVLQEQKSSATDSLAKTFAGLMLGYAEGNHIDMTETRKVYPFRTGSIRDYVQRIPVGHEI
jgi:uncharacterized protein YbjT (DUF2867 family)